MIPYFRRICDFFSGPQGTAVPPTCDRHRSPFYLWWGDLGLGTRILLVLGPHFGLLLLLGALSQL